MMFEFVSFFDIHGEISLIVEKYIIPG